MYLLPYLLLNRWQKKLTLSKKKKKKTLLLFFFHSKHSLSLSSAISDPKKNISLSSPKTVEMRTGYSRSSLHLSRISISFHLTLTPGQFPTPRPTHKGLFIDWSIASGSWDERDDMMILPALLAVSWFCISLWSSLFLPLLFCSKIFKNRLAWKFPLH